MKITARQFFNFVRENQQEKYDEPRTWSNPTKYYLKLWNHNHNKVFFLSWNWPAFFITPYWIFYRKMYLVGWIYFSFYILAQYITQFDHIHNYFPFLQKTLQKLIAENLNFNAFVDNTATAFWIGVAFFVSFIPPIVANPLYFYHVKKYILHNKKSKSGTSLDALILPILIQFFAAFLI